MFFSEVGQHHLGCNFQAQSDDLIGFAAYQVDTIDEVAPLNGVMVYVYEIQVNAAYWRGSAQLRGVLRRSSVKCSIMEAFLSALIFLLG